MQASKDNHSSKVNENKLNKHESEQEPQISIEIDGSVIQLPLSTFDNILDREITHYILNNSTYKNDIIDLKLINNEWESKYTKLKTQHDVLLSVIQRLERNLKINKFAQPMRINFDSVQTGVKITHDINIFNKVNTQGNSNKKHELIIISDSDDDDPIIVTEMSKTKPIQIQNENIINLTD